jgi:hypothetical protein
MPIDESKRQALIRKIESAFRGVVLGDGIGIYEAWAIDRCASDAERRKAREKDVRDDWTRISDEELTELYSALSFGDSDGLRSALPAYLRYAVRNFDKSDAASVDTTIYALESGWGGTRRPEPLFERSASGNRGLPALHGD